MSAATAGVMKAARDEMVKFDFSACGYWARLVMAVHILIGRPFLFDGIEIFDDLSRDD